MNAPVRVVCAVIKTTGGYLIAQRSETMSLPLQWEFPGGKVQPEESDEAALVREIQEELGCSISVEKKLTEFTIQNELTTLVMAAFLCSVIAGVPAALEHKNLQEVSPQEMYRYNFAIADIPIVKLLNEQDTYH